MVMETPPSPQCVGREFVRQYYTLLNEAPAHLHRFYNNSSSFIHGGLDPPNRETTLVIGQKQIHQKIQQLNFRDCHAKISQVDSQATLGNGVVVQVTGELSNGGRPMRRFTQTFVLAFQAPKKYYVHNDIFRYQDMLTEEEYEEMSRNEVDDDQVIQHQNALHTKASQVNEEERDDWTAQPMVNGTSDSHHHHEPQPTEQPPLPIHTVSQPIQPNSLPMQPVPQVIQQVSQPILVPQPVLQPIHTAPLPIHTAPLPIHTVPQPIHTAPQPIHTAPQPIHTAPQPIHTDPQPIHTTPQAILPVPHPMNTTNHPAYESPVPMELTPEPASIQQMPPQTLVPQNQTSSVLTPPQHEIRTESQNLETPITSHQNTSVEQEDGWEEPSQTLSQTSPNETGAGRGQTAQSTVKTFANLFKASPQDASTPYYPPPPPPTSHSPPPGQGRVDRPKPARESRGSFGRSDENVNISSTESSNYDVDRGRKQQQYSDNQQLFIGNIPHYATETALKDIFGKFGVILDMRVLSKPGVKPGSRTPPNYGFVIFENPASVQAVLNAKPIVFPDEIGTKLNVEEKKTKMGSDGRGPPSGRGGGRPGGRPSIGGNSRGPPRSGPPSSALPQRQPYHRR